MILTQQQNSSKLDSPASLCYLLDYNVSKTVVMQWECDTQNYVLIFFPKILSGSLTLLTITEITTTMIVKVSGKFTLIRFKKSDMLECLKEAGMQHLLHWYE